MVLPEKQGFCHDEQKEHGIQLINMGDKRNYKSSQFARRTFLELFPFSQLSFLLHFLFVAAWGLSCGMMDLWLQGMGSSLVAGGGT